MDMDKMKNIFNNHSGYATSSQLKQSGINDYLIKKYHQGSLAIPHVSIRLL